MNNTIESIWKNGFVDDETLIVPNVNNLYDRKSIHLIDQMKGMFRSNLNAIAIGSVLQFTALFMMGIPITGLIIFLILATIVFFGNKEMKRLDTIDKSENSYKYMKDFNQWTKHQITHYTRLYRFVYPMFLLSFPIGIWFSDKKQAALAELQLMFPDSVSLSGVPITVIALLILMTVILSFSGGALYRFELGLMYGKVITKLEEIIADMEELRS